jgi:small subunit ribosomal protein S12
MLLFDAHLCNFNFIMFILPIQFFFLHVKKMPTINQLLKYPRIIKQHTNNKQALRGCPQKKGVCIKVRIAAPKKPNSAQRKIVKIKITSTKRAILAYIPGQGHTLKSYSVALISGGRANDLPGVRFSLIRGLFDFT